MSSTTTTTTISLKAFAGLLLLHGLTGQGPSVVQGHMNLLQPPPLRGQNNKFYSSDNYDYSMTNPLAPDGSNFACKGYNTDVPSMSQAVDTLKAGGTYTVQLSQPGAQHGGGSCQWSLSYDGGKTFGVLHSAMGGCPIQLSYDIPIPKNIPAGKNVLLSWSWFNKVGNREMYQNCAAVDVESSSTEPLTLPAMFTANIYSDSCNTIEGDEVVFPNPGDSVEYGGMWQGKKPGKDDVKLNGCNAGQRDSKAVTLQSNTGASSGGSVSGDTKTATPTSVESSSGGDIDEHTSTDSSEPETTEDATPTSSDVSQPEETGDGDDSETDTETETETETETDDDNEYETVTQTATATATAPEETETESPSDGETDGGETTGETCSGTVIKCSEDGGSFSACSNGKWVSMGDVAGGTICRNGAINRAASPANGTSPGNTVTCSPGSIVCSEDGTTFSLCAANGASLHNMGSVAAGTQCVNGQISAARMIKQRRYRHRRSSHFY